MVGKCIAQALFQMGFEWFARDREMSFFDCHVEERRASHVVIWWAAPHAALTSPQDRKLDLTAVWVPFAPFAPESEHACNLVVEPLLNEVLLNPAIVYKAHLGSFFCICPLL